MAGIVGLTDWVNEQLEPHGIRLDLETPRLPIWDVYVLSERGWKPVLDDNNGNQLAINPAEVDWRSEQARQSFLDETIKRWGRPG